VRNRAIIVFCLLLGGVARPESVTVEAPKPQESSRHVRIVVMLGGKPLRGVTIDFYPIAAQPHFSAITDEDGIATPPDLALGNYNIVARLDEDVSTSLSLHVVPERMVSTFSLDLTEGFAQAQRAQQAAESLPIRDRVKSFRGTVLDPTGAVIAGTNIRVVRKGSQEKAVALRVKSDAKGNFSGQLGEGSYIAFVFSQGFRTAIVPFEVTKDGSGDLRITMQIGHT
jgi:hypothetical protein